MKELSASLPVTRSAGWLVGENAKDAYYRIIIADSYSAVGKCKEENTKYRMRLSRIDKSELVRTE